MSAPAVGLRETSEAPIAGATRMRVQVFPVMATLARLQELCNEQFNKHIPPEVAIFQPALPVVFCGILHYPDMGGRVTWRTGSLSQNELYFLVPLERHRLVHGRKEFVELAATTPYIFVDNPESVAAGRERFGMPKEYAKFSTDFEDIPWDVGTQRYLRIQSYEPTANGLRLSPLLDIIYSTLGMATSSQRDDDIPRPATHFGPLEWLKIAAEVRDLGERTFGAETVASVLARLQTYLQLLQGKQRISLFSLRQFADPEDAVRARYSDLIAFRMKMMDVQALNLLGQGPLLSQFQLRLRRTELRPIAKILGLRVSQRTAESKNAETVAYEAIDALCPFYAQLDTDLLGAERVCWHHDQGDGASWRDDAGNALSPVVAGTFNTYFGPSGSAFLQPQTPPPILDLKYLMVAAKRGAIEQLLDEILPSATPLRGRITVAGQNPDFTALRLLFSRSRPGPWRHRGEMTWNDGAYLSIAIPVVVDGPNGPFDANFMVHEFANNAFTVQSMRSMLGEPTTYAEFEESDGGWFSSTRDFTKPISLSCMAVERTSSGAVVRSSKLLDVFRVSDQVPGADDLAPGILEGLREELWSRISVVLPSVSVGHIPDPCDETRSVLDRVMITYFHEEMREHVVTRPEATRHEHIVLFHDNDTYPIARRTGLVTLNDSSVLGGRLARIPSMGQTYAVPVLAAGEGVSRVLLDRFEIISESAPHGR